MPQPTVFYIASVGHSGSTLLDVLIGSHDDVFGLGEIKNLNPRVVASMTCSCSRDRRPLLDCPFWIEAGERLERRHRLSLCEIDLDAPDPRKLLEHHDALYGVLVEMTGKTRFVDSSKDSRRLELFVRSDRHDVYPIHLLRSPQGVAYSAMRKESDWWTKLRAYQRHARRTQRFLHSIEHSIVRYEDLARDPSGVLVKLMPRLGLEYLPAQLDWAGRERHNCGGNRMRRAETSEIRLDTSWRSELSPFQKAAAGLVGLRIDASVRRSAAMGREVRITTDGV